MFVFIKGCAADPGDVWLRADRILSVSETAVCFDRGCQEPSCLIYFSGGRAEAERIVRDVQAALVFRAEAPAGADAGVTAGLMKQIDQHQATARVVEVRPGDEWAGEPWLWESTVVPLTPPLVSDGFRTARADAWGGLPAGPPACHKPTRDQYREGPCRRPAGHDGDCRP